MKSLRLLAYFLIGFMLSVTTVLAYAETVSAQAKPAGTLTVAAEQRYDGGGRTDNISFAAACNQVRLNYGGLNKGTCQDDTPQPWHDGGAALGYCRYQNTPTSCGTMTSDGVTGVYYCPAGYARSGGTCINNVTIYVCSTGQNWTLTGQSCVRPDCVAPEVRDSVDGVCKVPPNCDPDPTTGAKPASCVCPQSVNSPSLQKVWVPFEGCRENCGRSANEQLNAGWDFAYAKGTSSACVQGCKAYPGETYYTGKDGMRYGPMLAMQGQTCVEPGNTPPAEPVNKLDESKIKPPVCGSGEGVLTSSSGSVKCVPSGTPAASTPKVETAKKTETYPDNTTKTTTTTTTTDPTTGASDTRSTSVTTAKADGTAGQAGAPGTTTGTESKGGTDSNGDGDGDGDCDPTLQMCGKPSTEGLYEKKDKTFGSVLTKFSDDMKATPIGQAMEDTLNITVPSSGACPNLSANIPYLNTTIDLAPYICSPTAIEYFELMGTVLKIVVGYIALTWVFL